MIKYKKDTDNIVTLIMDMAGRRNNVINHEIGEAFVPIIDHLKKEKKLGALRGVILTSAKKTFLAGGDLDYLFKAEDPAEIFAFSQKLKGYLRELESPGVPVVAAINGTALGTGFEVALACHHRMVIDDPGIRLGNPEVQLGMMPGAGGILRLMWLLGIAKAFPILTNGQRYSPGEALKVGIIDELARDQKEMMEKAKAWLLQTKEGRRPWDMDHCTIPGGTAREPKVANLIQELATQLNDESNGQYPAPQAILNVMAEGSKVDFDTACRIESRYYTELLRSRPCKNMIKAFWFDFNAIKKGTNRPKGYGKFRPKKVGVIGAGQMGSGIAFACLQAGLEVVLKDVSKLIAERARLYVGKKLDHLQTTGRIEAAQAEKILKRISTTEASEDFEQCDLIIEAVFENQMVKQKVMREAEEYIDEYSLFASNTVSIPITRLAEASMRPENYVGLHFFHPADEVPLVEIVKGAKTSDETIARAFDFVNAIKKVPIVVKDDWGFYAGRVRNTFILEGITMLEEGYAPALIENLGRQAGMPSGALALADHLGLNMILKYEQQAAENYGAKYIQHPAVSVISKMLKELDRPGGQKKAGFYDYQEGNIPRLWIELAEHFPVTKTDFHKEELIERFLFAQVIEAVWCMQEGVIQSVPAANLGSIYGWGFPSYKGGVMQYVHDYGMEQFVERCKKYEKQFGQRFKAPPLLKKMAKGQVVPEQ